MAETRYGCLCPLCSVVTSRCSCIFCYATIPFVVSINNPFYLLLILLFCESFSHCRLVVRLIPFLRCFFSQSEHARERRSASCSVGRQQTVLRRRQVSRIGLLLRQKRKFYVIHVAPSFTYRFVCVLFRKRGRYSKIGSDCIRATI